MYNGLMDRGALEFELKFLFSSYRVPFIQKCLHALCLPDGLYPRSVVHSLYFDTIGLDYLMEKQNSDYLKQKVRLRWYDDKKEFWFEVKQKIGTKRIKYRKFIPPDLNKSNMPWNRSFLFSLPTTGKSLGLPINTQLLPSIYITYLRERFIEPSQQLRVSLDWGISTDIKREFGHPNLSISEPRWKEPPAVLEIKGSEPELPRTLKFLTQFGLKKSAYSKYSFGFLEV